jgi:hypothetical protein
MGRWAMNLIVETLLTASRRGDKRFPSTGSSLFMDFAVSDDFQVTEEIFATTFMAILACNIARHVDRPVLEQLKRESLFGLSGLDRACEYKAHQTFLESSNGHLVWCLSADGQYHSLQLGGKRKVLIRSIEDIKSLKVGDYGLPCCTNFPLVDAVILPNTVLRMTMCGKHGVAPSKLDEIAAALGVAIDNLNMVYVVPSDEVKSFVFSSNARMRRTKQLVTSSEPAASSAAFQKLISCETVVACITGDT